MEMLEVMRSRRSVRRYTDEPLTDEQLKQIVTAALLAPSGHSKYPCEFIIVKNRELLERMSHCRKGVAKMLAGAAAANTNMKASSIAIILFIAVPLYLKCY